MDYLKGGRHALLGTTYLMAVVIASLIYMVRERTWEFFLFDELAAFVICVLIWRESRKWVVLVKKIIWRPQPCAIENNPPDTSIPEPQLISEETDSDFEIIEDIYSLYLTLSVGMFCRAPYSGDGQFYEAKVLNVGKDTCVVEFLGYGKHQEEVDPMTLKESLGKKARKCHRSVRVSKDENSHLRVGMCCRAPFSGDGQYYEAKVRKVGKDTWTVEFLGYGHQEEMDPMTLRESLGKKARNSQRRVSKDKKSYMSLTCESSDAGSVIQESCLNKKKLHESQVTNHMPYDYSIAEVSNTCHLSIQAAPCYALPQIPLGTTYLMAIVIASLVYMVRKRTWEFLPYDELAAFVISVLIWRESYKWVVLVKKIIWKPQPCAIENNPPDMSTPEPQLISEKTDSYSEIIEEECHTDYCSNIPQETLDEDALKRFVFNTKGDGDPTLESDDCTSEVNSRVSAFYRRVATHLANVYSIVSPGNTSPEVRVTNVLKLMLTAIHSVKFDDPQSSDPTNEVGEITTSTDNLNLNENDRTEALAFTHRVFDFISHKLAIDRKNLKETVNPTQEYECKIMHKFVIAHILSTPDNPASSEVNFEVDTMLLLFERFVTHLVEIFALVKPGNTTPETKFKIIKRTLFHKIKFDKELEDTSAKNPVVVFLKRSFDNLRTNDVLKNPEAGEATVAETVEIKSVVGNSTNESGEDTTIAEDSTLSAHEVDELISFIERIFEYLDKLVDLKNLKVVEAAVETGNSTPEAEDIYIENFIVDMVYFLNR